MKKKQKPRYGIRSYAMVNSGNHALSVLPMHGPLSISGANNLGKTQALQSMQFLWFTNTQHMSFGSHDIKTSRAYFFPSDNSYLLMEVWVPDGIYIIGAYGKGAGSGNEYELFIAKCELDIDDFKDENDVLRSHKSLFAHWASKNIEVMFTTREEMRKILYGEYFNVKGCRWDVTMVPLANSSERRYQVFRQVYKNLLTQQTLRGKEMKDLILNIFNDKLTNSQLNFIDVKEKAFRRYNLQKDEIAKLELRRPDIENLVREQARRDEKVTEASFLLRELSVNLRNAVNRLPDMIAQQTALLNEHKGEKSKLDQTQVNRLKSLESLITEKSRLTQLQDEIRSLEHKTSLSSRDQVESSLAAISTEYSTLSEQISQAEQFQLSAVNRKIDEAQRSVKSLENKLNNLKNNDHLLKHTKLSDAEKSALSLLLRQDVFDLPSSALDEKTPGSFEAFLRTELLSKEFTLNGHGFELSLNSLDAKAFVSIDINEIKDQLTLEKDTLKKLIGQRDVATNHEKAKHRLTELSADVRKFQGYLRDYDRLEYLLQNAESLAEDIAVNDESLAEIRMQIDSFKSELETCNENLSMIEADLKKSLENQKSLAEIQRNRHIQKNTFGVFEGDDSMFERNLNEYEFKETEIRIEALSQAIGNIDLSINHSRERIISDFPNLSEHSDSSSLAANAKESVDSLPHMRALLKRMHHESIITLSGALRDLATNYQTLEHEIYQFNNRINSRRVSNLKRISIHLRKNEPILDSIATLLEYLSNEEAQKSDMFSVQTGDISNAELNRALDRLTKTVEEGRDGNLELCDLFELSFGTLDVHGKEIICEKLDELASNGSTMTLKPLFYMSMIRYMMDRGAKHECFLPFYIDEVASVDDNNQNAVLAYCDDMCFTPVFSSVDPATTVAFNVNLAECLTDDNRIYVTEADWHRYEHMTESEESTSTEEQLVLV